MNTKPQTACFTGHRFIPADEAPALKERLAYKIVELAEQGILHYGCGAARGFDMLAGFTLLELREKIPDLKLIMVVPYRYQGATWLEDDRKKYVKLLAGADKVTTLSDEYYDGCLLDRNRHLVEYSSVCIAYLKHKRSGTAFTVRLAREQGLTVFNLAE